MSLTELLDTVRSSAGLHCKTEIQLVQRHLAEAYPAPFPNGDDAAVIPSGDGFDLLAGEGFIDAFVSSDPWFAGWCGVMVNVSDIAAMGGRPVAVVNALWGGNDAATADVLRGMAAASRAYQVPIVGGHTNLRCAEPRLAVSILGRANRVLDAFAAKPGQVLIAAIDLRGAYQPPYNHWNAATQAPPERLRGDIALLPAIAECGLATAAKDISQAGLLGTCVMLLESSGTGVDIDLAAIPKPAGVDWVQWLTTFPSYGYLLATDARNVAALLARFHRREIAAAAIGTLNPSGLCQVHTDATSELFWDVQSTPLTALRKHHAGNLL